MTVPSGVLAGQRRNIVRSPNGFGPLTFCFTDRRVDAAEGAAASRPAHHWSTGGLGRCSVVSPSSTVVRPRCGSSTPSGTWPRRPGHGSRRSPCTPTSTDRHVRPRSRPRLRPRSRVRAPVPRPEGPGARAGGDRGRRRVGRLGLRRRGPGVRRAVREDRGHLRRTEPGSHAQARRQDRREADRRGGRRAGRAVEPRRGRDPGGRAGGGGRDRLPADAEGDRGRRRPRHPRGRPATTSSPTPTSAPARRPRGRSAAASCSWSAWSPAPGTSRSR